MFAYLPRDCLLGVVVDHDVLVLKNPSGGELNRRGPVVARHVAQLERLPEGPGPCSSEKER